MTRAEILAKVRDLLSDTVDDPDLKITEATTAEDVADWDSTNHVRLIVAIESDFGIRFETNEISTPQNVGELVTLIETKLK